MEIVFVASSRWTRASRGSVPETRGQLLARIALSGLRDAPTLDKMFAHGLPPPPKAKISKLGNGYNKIMVTPWLPRPRSGSVFNAECFCNIRQVASSDFDQFSPKIQH